MLKITVSATLALLLIGLLLQIPDLTHAQTNGTVYIRQDGSIDPPTAPIQRSGDLYTLTANIISDSDGIVIERDNMILDGGGFAVQGTVGGSSYPEGVSGLSRTNVTIKNLEIKDFYFGVLVLYSPGIQLLGNNVTANTAGISLKYSSYAILRNNRMINNTFNFYVLGNTLSHYVHDVDGSNTVEEKSIYYRVNETNVTVPTDSGYVALVNSTRMVMENLTLARNGQGVLFAYTTDSRATANNITENSIGIELVSSSNNTIRENVIDNNMRGVLASQSSINMITRNNVTSNQIAGIEFYSSPDNVISRNNIKENGRGLWVSTSSSNVVYRNNFVNNMIQASVSESTIAFDDGYPSGGNFWSDNHGIDTKCGPNQDQVGPDGMSDMSYAVGLSNHDRYPLMRPWTPPTGHDVAILGVVSYKTVVGRGYCATIDVYISNLGEYDEAFNVTIYGNAVQLRSQSVILNAEDSIGFSVIWNTSGFDLGAYSLSALTSVVADEKNLTNNSYSDGTITVALVGDLTGLTYGVPDGKCDIRDVAMVAKYFGQNTPPAPANCDMTGPTQGLGDGVVDIRDLAVVAKNFGKYG